MCPFYVRQRARRQEHARSRIWTDECRTPPLTFRRACAGIRLTDGTGTQGQAGYAHAVLRGIVPQPRQKPKGRPGHSPGGWLTASGCESKDRQGGYGICYVFSYIRGLWEALRWYWGCTAVGCAYEDKNLLISEKRGKQL